MIYLARHGQSTNAAKGLYQGQQMCPLSELGILQAKDAALRLEALPIKHIISSDLERARQTADIINEKFKLRIELDERLREYDGGKFENTALADIPTDFKTNPSKYGVETSRDMFIRVKSFWDSFIKRKLDEVLIVCHEGAMAMLVYILENPNVTVEQIPNDRELAQYRVFKNAEILAIPFPL